MSHRFPVLSVIAVAMAGIIAAGAVRAADKAPDKVVVVDAYRQLTCQVGQASVTHMVVGEPDIVTTPGGVFMVTGTERLDSGETAPFKIFQQGGQCSLVKATPPTLALVTGDGRFRVVIDVHHDQDVVWHAEASVRPDEPLRLKSKTEGRPGEEVPTWVGLELRLNAKGDGPPTAQYTITHYDHGALSTLSNTAKVGADGSISGKTPGYDTAQPLDYTLTVSKL
jgi:hypothetical protein